MHGCIKKKGNSCMIIKHNLSSYNSNRQLGIVVDRQKNYHQVIKSFVQQVLLSRKNFDEISVV